MTDNKSLIHAYLTALSGAAKTPELVARFVTDPELIQHIADVEASFPCYEIGADALIAEGDLVIVRGQFRGIHQGPFAGIAPTGRAVTAGLIIIYRVENEKVVQHWMQFDLFGLIQQLQSAATAAA